MKRNITQAPEVNPHKTSNYYSGFLDIFSVNSIMLYIPLLPSLPLLSLPNQFSKNALEGSPPFIFIKSPF